MSIRVFVIDGGRLAAEGVTALLRFMGHTVHTAGDAESVLDEALAFRPDLALIDWAMPDAEEVCRAMALSGSRLVALGSVAHERPFREAAEARLAAFLTLPCDRSTLSHVLTTAEDDIFERRDQMKCGVWQSPLQREVGRRYWIYLAETTVFRLYGGTRDGQELFGDRAASLYYKLGEEPLHRTFFACRSRLLIEKRRTFRIVERHRYFVEAVLTSPDRTLMIARSCGGGD
jgi:CheY-like chemotaxis protein